MYILPYELVVFVKNPSNAFLALLWLQYITLFLGRVPSELLLLGQ